MTSAVNDGDSSCSSNVDSSDDESCDDLKYSKNYDIYFEDKDIVYDQEELNECNDIIMNEGEVEENLINEEFIKNTLTSYFYNDDQYDAYVESSLKIIGSLEKYFKSNSYLNRNTKINDLIKQQSNFMINRDSFRIDSDKNTLVLDVDETLLHSDSPAIPNEEYDHLIELGYGISLGISIRPNLFRFLEFAS